MSKDRCPWAAEKEIFFAYHDREWGRPVHNDARHLEMITLEGAQAGLSWETVLRKRDRYRQVFYKFDPAKVAKMSARKIDSMMKDSGLIRHRGKLESTVSNAKAFTKIQEEFGSFDRYVWRFVDGKPIINAFRTMDDYPAATETSTTISKDLKRRGFGFVGTTTIYAYMQAAGLTNDHAVDCFLHGKKLRALDETCRSIAAELGSLPGRQ